MSQPRNIVRVREASHTSTQSSSWLMRQRMEAIHYSFDWCLLCNRWRNYWKDWKLELENLKWIKQITFFLQFSCTGNYANSSSKQYMKDGMALNSPVRPYETSRSAADLQQICFDRNRSTADYFIVCRVCFQSAADVKLEYPSRC